MDRIILLILSVLLFSCKQDNKVGVSEADASNTISEVKTEIFESPNFTITEANKLLELPLHCVTTQYPNKLGQTIGGKEDLAEPKALHPIFYGCFDWHSAVHGYWSMVTLLDKFPEMDKAEEAIAILEAKITKENVTQELMYFNKPLNKSYERTYGWAWLLKLAEALNAWDHPKAKQLEGNLAPLTQKIIANYEVFLPKLMYPIRVGEHTNTAFGLAFAFDYAITVKDTNFAQAIKKRAKEFYLEDYGCPIKWEPSGYDFLSPCLEELDIMRRVLSKADFKKWLASFMPELIDKNYTLDVAKVSDRSDGKLVHLDGLNFSRAWVLYGLASTYPEYSHLNNIANEHLKYSYPNLVGDSYEGGHWLGSFAIYALSQNKQ